MTVLDLLFLTVFTVCALVMATVTPINYRPAVYLVLAIGWGFVLIYLAAPPGALEQKLHHWTR